MSQLGRIGGTLLYDNLVRNGVDLSFKNHGVSDPLLYIDVNNGRVGVNQLPSNDLSVSGTTRSTNFIAGTDVDIYNVTVNSNSFSTNIVTGINIVPNQADPLVIMDHLQADNLDFKDNVISATSANGKITLDTNGTGIVDIYANTTVNGDLTVTGNIGITGNLSEYTNIIVGDAPLDTVVVVPDFSQSIIPGTTNTYDLGSLSKRWRSVYSHQNSDIGTLHYNDITVSMQMFIESGLPSISTLQSNDNLLLSPDTGITYIERYKFQGDEITNIDETLGTIGSTGIGYTRIMDNNGMVIPYGTNAERSGFYSTPEVGTTRWNTDNPADNYLECFDGTTWNLATGAGGSISAVENYDLANAYILMLG